MSKCYRITDPYRHDEVIAYTYDKDEAKSFCLINDKEWEKIKEEEAENDPNFSDLLISEICGILLPCYLIPKMKTELRDLVYPLKITEGVLLNAKQSCTYEEKKAINRSLEIIKRQQIELLESAVQETTYDQLYDFDKEFNIDWL